MIRVIAVALAVLIPLPAQSCKLALMLGIDVSHSIDNGEYAFQVGGLAEALSDPVVAAAMVELQVALAVTQWSGDGEQDISIPWTRIITSQQLKAFQARVRSLRRPWTKSNTAVGQAISTMVEQFSDVPDCARRVIDFSGDGINNAGVLPVGPRGMAMRQNITINGLAIDRVGRSVTEYFKRHVITGRGSFVITATGYRDYPRAIRAKLFQELLPPSS